VIEVGEVEGLKLKDLLVCTNDRCPRLGLLTVIFAQLEEKGSKEGGESKDDEVRAKDANKQDGKTR